MLKKIALGLALLIAILAALIFINPQINPSHTSPYLNLQAERLAAPPAEGDIQQRVILYGDAGHSTTEPWQPSMAYVARRASLSPAKTAVVALGDNIYMRGYPRKEEGQEDWTEDQLESISFLDAQLRVATESGARMIFVPGNHDWYATELDSQAGHIARFAEDNRVDTRFQPHVTGQPPYPEFVNLVGVSLVFLDSEWLLHAEGEQRERALATLDAAMASIRATHPQNLIVLNAHHPLETMGQHGGYLAEFSYWFFITLIHSLFPEAADEDTPSPIYQQMIADLNRVMSKYQRVIYAAGHEHSLQVFRGGGPQRGGAQYTLVSGAANSNKLSGVWHNDNTRFALSQEGFMELNLTDAGVYLQVFDVHSEDPVAGFWLDI